MIDVKIFNSYILIQEIKEHNYIKEELLSLIEKTTKKFVEGPVEKISSTDYYVSKEIKRTYEDLFLQLIEPYNNNIKKFYKANNIYINNFWYQQYDESDYHNWHVHPSSLLSNVYFLQLENKNSTLFYDYVTQNKIKYDLKEGDLITFPAILPHKSEKNFTSKKTIISFNTDIDNINIQ